MKKRVNKKTVLNKKTISNLQAEEIKNVKGGFMWTDPDYTVCQTFGCTEGACDTILCMTAPLNTACAR